MAILDVDKNGKAPGNAAIGDTIRTAGGDFRITGGSAGNYTSERVSSGGGGSRDYSAIISDPTSTYAQRQEAYGARQAKQDSMQAAGTWDYNWLPTSAYRDRVSSDYNAAQNSTSPYASASSSYADMMRSNNDQARELYAAKVRQGVDRLNAQKTGINQSYDNAATQAYVSYMQGQRQMPLQMASLGMTGGASESSMIGARSAYEGNVNNINTSRQKALNDIDSAIIDLQNSGDIETAQYVLNNADKIAENYVQALYSDIGRSDTMRQNDISNAYQRAGLTGDLGGTPTLQSKQLDLDRQQLDATLTGTYNGKPTYEAQQSAYDNALKLAVYSGDFSPLRNFNVPESTISAAYSAYLREQAKLGGGGKSGKKKKKKGSKSYPAVSFGSGDSTTPTEEYGNDYNLTSILDLGYGPIAKSSLETLIQQGKAGVDMVNGKIKVSKTGNQNAQSSSSSTSKSNLIKNPF